MSRFFKSAAFPILIVVVLAFFAQRLISPSTRADTPTYSDFLTQLERRRGQDRRPEDEGQHRRGHAATTARSTRRATPTTTATRSTQPAPAPPRAEQAPDDYNIERHARRNGWLSLLTYVLPFLIFIGFWIFLMNQVQGGGSKVMSFGKSRAKRMSVDSPKITFRDVAGVDEAVEELHEIKEFLENPKKFQALGARIPKGVLLYGPPGTGKTLLARAVAGEAGVPFFSISGSDFVEMFVGVGASPRARPLRAGQAELALHHLHGRDRRRRPPPRRRPGRRSRRARADAQPAARRDGRLRDEGQHHPDRRHQPPDILDPALLRPGRFDRQIVVDRPDRKGRAKILEVHTRGKPLAKEIDVDTLAGQTPGFTGADLAQPRQRGRAARRPQRQARDHPGRARRGDHARDRRPGEEDPGDEREGAPDHRLPRDGPRDRRPLPRALRPGPQDLDHQPRPGARLHDLDAAGGQVPHDARRAAPTRWR